MASEQTLHTHDINEQESVWMGGKEPFKASYGKLMMWYFLLSDAFTFAGFLIAYGTLRFSSATWPVPDFVFSSLPGGIHHKPLIFVTFMTFVLIVSSVTMVRAVQEGHRYNKKGVVFWMLMTILGGLCFLGCQAWEWTTLMGGEHMTIHKNPFGTHIESGVYLEGDGHDVKAGDTFHIGTTYLIHKHGEDWAPLKYKVTSGDIKEQQFGPKAFGALFFFITGFHGFHVLSGVAFLLIIMINVASGVYAQRKNHYEMVEKIGLYWHFVDLVWVFVFLVFYLL
ncbi:MAG: cytochrome c oxidase subunit 3 [Saprospiraceae bacterium]|nr:cytochrome c oxidase subunit 3 [Saprospiraceae bacterium]MBK9221683.1 cytochrome c oxidase subunit 3 [Saprospiraceae bacterium]MBK9721380.1 cytochrome c oxidase subunit 3 [Saprospiraceae bacterium]MBK9728391.1 cytochrome c oxidase subunit 3 [Saprospiraceae bacterium]